MKESTFFSGIREGFPIVFGYMPLGLAFGVLAVQSGLKPAEATAMSALAFTGAGQYIAIGILAAGGQHMAIVLANLLINLRYLLFSASLVPQMSGLPVWLSSVLMLGLTDETYAVSVTHARNEKLTSQYLGGLNLTAYLAWVLSTLAGTLIGHMIGDTDRLGLNFALPAMYTILLILVASGKKHVLVAFIAAFTALALAYFFPAMLGNLSNIIVAAIAAATVGVLTRK